MNNSRLQDDIKSPRDILKEKLRNKIIKIKQQQERVSPQQTKKINKLVDKEKKANDNDPRVTPKMNEYFIHALKSYPGEPLKSPHDLLEDAENEKINYYNFCIKILKDNNNNSELLNNPYCNYIKCVLNIE
jgi:hypothetical protein